MSPRAQAMRYVGLISLCKREHQQGWRWVRPLRSLSAHRLTLPLLQPVDDTEVQHQAEASATRRHNITLDDSSGLHDAFFRSRGTQGFGMRSLVCPSGPA